MAEKKEVKQEGLNMMSWVQQQEANVNERAARVQDAAKSGTMSNDGSGKNWNYNIGACE